MPYVPRRATTARHATTRRRAPAAKSAGKPKPKPKPVAAIRRRPQPAVKRTAVAFVDGKRQNGSKPTASSLVRAKANSGDLQERSGHREGEEVQRSGLDGPRVFDVPDDNAGFPQRKWVKFNYQDVLEITTAPATIADFSYAMNGMYDPYIPTGGHQPRYFDTYFGGDNTGSPYKNFRVHGCKVEVTFVNTEATDSEVIVFLHWRNSQASTLGGIIDIGEVPNTISALMGMASGQPPITLTQYIKIAPILGLEELEDSDDTAGDYTGDPLDAVYLDVGCIPVQGTESAIIVAKVNLTYYSECFNQNFPVAS